MSTLETALVHTLLGIGIVFVILILISFIISLFKYIPVIQKKFSKKPEVKAAPTPAPAVEEPVVEEAEADTDDLELVAVITAAVAAALGTTDTDGFVVRSIRRTNGNHWKRY